MATLINGIQFTGSLGNISGYTRKGSDKNFARTKGGADKDRIMNDPALELTKQNSVEFAGCGKAAGTVRQAVLPLAHLAAPNFNINASATKILKVIQTLDEEGKRGERGIYFSRYKQLFEGFTLNPVHTFSSIVLLPLYSSIDRDNGIATIILPALYPDINLLFPWNYPVFRFILHLGVVADITYGEAGFELIAGNQLPYAKPVYTEWQYARENYAGDTITIPLSNKELLQPGHSLLLSAGIEMGTPISNHLIKPEKKKGSASILLTA